MTTPLADLEVAGRIVAVRCDLNVPLRQDNGGEGDSGGVVITDDGRIRASIPTLEDLLIRGARVVVLAHLGRPKGQVDDALSLEPVALRLAELLNRPVRFIRQTSGPDLAKAVRSLSDGEIALVENVRFDSRETSKSAEERAALADDWATWAEAFVSDGFGVVHREQASVTDLARRVPRAAGLLVDREREAFSRVLSEPERPYAVVLGGSKVSDKLGVIEHLLERVDMLLIGGGMAFTFLRAQGHSVGRSLLEESMLGTVEEIMQRADERGVRILLPVDVVVAERISEDAPSTIVDVEAIPEDAMGLDIGPRTIAEFSAAIGHARTIVWNGPMGVFEIPSFAEGTRAIAEAIAASEAFTVVGGGDSAAAIRALDIGEDRFGHISTGGGASLELLEGKDLPGLVVLEEGSA